MEIVFLGTASNNPTPVRGVSATCFRFGKFLTTTLYNFKKNYLGVKS